VGERVLPAPASPKGGPGEPQAEGNLMPKAFIMIDVVPGHEAEVERAVEKLAGVTMVYQVTGQHDLIAFIDAEPYAEFAVVLSGIRQLEGIRDTDSYLVLGEK